MPKYLPPDTIDNGLVWAKDLITTMRLVSQYSIGDSFLTVDANTLVKTTVNPASVIISSSGNNRVIQFPSALGTGLVNFGAGSGDLHVVVTDDNNSRVLFVTDETSEQAIATGQSISIPAWNFYVRQPV